MNSLDIIAALIAFVAVLFAFFVGTFFKLARGYNNLSAKCTELLDEAEEQLRPALRPPAPQLHVVNLADLDLHAPPRATRRRPPATPTTSSAAA